MQCYCMSLSLSAAPRHTGAGYEEGEMLKNITSWLLSDTVQNSMSSAGLTPTYQNATVGCSVSNDPLLW